MSKSDVTKERLLTIPEVCERYKLSRSTLYKLLASDLPSVKIGKSRRIASDDIEEFVRAHRAQ